MIDRGTTEKQLRILDVIRNLRLKWATRRPSAKSANGSALLIVNRSVPSQDAERRGLLRRTRPSRAPWCRRYVLRA